MEIQQTKRAELLTKKSVEKDKVIFRHIGSRKILAFIGQNSCGYFYAFGSPSQSGGYIAFNTKGYEEAESKIYEHLSPML